MIIMTHFWGTFRKALSKPIFSIFNRNLSFIFRVEWLTRDNIYIYNGNAIVDSGMIRREDPLYIVIDGDLLFGRDVRIDGVSVHCVFSKCENPSQCTYRRRRVYAQGDNCRADAILPRADYRTIIQLETGQRCYIHLLDFAYKKK